MKLVANWRAVLRHLLWQVAELAVRIALFKYLRKSPCVRSKN